MQQRADPERRERTSRSPSQAVVESVAAREGVDPTELSGRLYDAVDPDALDALFGTREGTRFDGRVVFDYHGYEVTVLGPDEVELRE